MRLRNIQKLNVVIPLTRIQEAVLTETPLHLFRSSMGFSDPRTKLVNTKDMSLQDWNKTVVYYQ